MYNMTLFSCLPTGTGRMLRRKAGSRAAAAAAVVLGGEEDEEEVGGETIEMINLQALKEECVLKILLVGGKQVGKTSFIRRFADKPFPRQYVPTVGFDLIVIPVFYAGRKVFLHFWDASYEEVRSSPSHHALLCHNVAGVFYVLDVSSRESLEAVDNWHRLLAKYIPSRVPSILLAHKADLPRASYVVSDRALESYVRDAGLTDWCYTVGHEGFGDYVAHRGFESKSVSDAVHMLVDHIFKTSGPSSRRLRAPLEPLPPLHGGWRGGSSPPAPQHAADPQWAAGSAGRQPQHGGGRGVLQPPQGWLLSVDIGELCSRSKRLQRSPTADQHQPPGARQRRTRLGWEEEEEEEENDERRPGVGAAMRNQPQGTRVDRGWRHYAGWIDRDHAMRLLEKEPVGAFLLRRKDECSLVLTYKTPGSIEHAPIAYDGKQWSPEVPSSRPSTSTSTMVGGSMMAAALGSSSSSSSSSPSPRQSQQQHQQQPPQQASRQVKFNTLEDLLRYFSKKASVGTLTFRRKPGTAQYEVIKKEPQPRQQAPPLRSPGQQAPVAVDKMKTSPAQAAGVEPPPPQLEAFVLELETVLMAVSVAEHGKGRDHLGSDPASTGEASEHHDDHDEDPADEEEEEEGEQYDNQPMVESGGEKQRRMALLELSKRTEELLLRGGAAGGAAAFLDMQKEKRRKGLLPEGEALVCAIKHVEEQLDAIIAWQQQLQPGGGNKLEDRAMRCLLAWRPLLRVFRLRVHGLGSDVMML